MRRWLLAAALAAPLAGGALVASRAAEEDKGILASVISRALSTPATRVSIGAIDGALSSDATIRNLEISDRDGVWLKLDRARISWRRLALIQRRLEVDTLEVDHLDVLRRPIPAEGAVAGEDQPLLPELPVKVEIKDFKLTELAIGEPILGTRARVAMNGSAKLGDPSEGLDLKLDGRRLDQPGTLAARLGLVPQGQRLTLSFIVDEPAGGIVARAAGIPGEPPVKLDLGGSGTLDNFQARLGFNAGDGIGADGAASVTRAGAARQLALDLQARISGLLPGVAAPVFAGTTRLTGNAAYGDDGALSIPGITLQAAAARLDIAGTVSADKQADLTVRARNVLAGAAGPGGAADRTAVSGAEIRRLAFDGRVTGAVAAPRVDATLAVEDARLPSGRLDRLDATLATVLGNAPPGQAARLQLTANATATGLVPSDPALARAIGREATLSVKGTATTEGVVNAELLEIKTPTLAARYAGRIASSELRGKAEASVGDLARLSDLAGLPGLRGAATLAADLEGTPRARRVNATLSGRVARFASGIATVDGLAGGRLGIEGGLRVTPTGDYGFDDLRLTGEAASARLNGTIGQEQGALDLLAAIPDLKRADARLSGRADLTARLTGGLQHPDATAKLQVANAAALGRPIPRLALDVTARDLRGNPEARLVLDGEVDKAPARGTLRLARTAAGETRLDEVDLRVGSVTAKGGVTLDAANLAAGRLAVAAGNLDDLSPLLLTKLGGSLDADVTLETVGGGQNAAVKADATRLSGYGATLERLTADLRVTDLYRRPVIAGQASVDDATVGGEPVRRVRFTATGTPAASDVVLTAAARGFDLDGRARIIPGERTRIELSQLGATRGRQRLAIAQPATLTVVDGGLDIRNLALGLGSGRLTVEGLAGRQLNLRVGARAVPLSVADVFAPGLGLAGVLEGDAQVTGPASSPAGEYRARINGLAAPQTRNAGLPPIDVTASGRLGGGRSTLDATLAAGRAGSLRIDGSVPLGQGALDLAVRGTIDAGSATARLLGAAGRRLTGRVEVDAKVGGTLAAPQASGAATLSGGSFTDAGQGVSVDNIRARVVARGDEVTIESASASTRNGGTLGASGRVRLDPGAGFPGQIRVTGTRAELVRSPIATAVANLALDVSGPLAQDPRVGGRVEIVSLDVTIPDRLPSSLKPLANTRHLNPTRTARARLALDAQRNRKRGAPAFDARFDLVIAAPGQIFVRGRGLNAELGGDLRLTGTLAQPRAVGAFSLRSGRLQIVSSRLDFSRGNLTFSGDLSPELDFLATTNAGGASIGVAITGPASDPQFAFTSSPDLPPDEVLSRILFGAPSGQLTTGQALALAQAAAQYGGGEGAFEDLRKSLGLSGVDVGGGGVGLTRNLGDRFSIGVNAGVNSGVEANFRITDEIKIKGGFSPTGGTSVGIGAEYEWGGTPQPPPAPPSPRSARPLSGR